jgi:hypothetical protein
MLQKLEELSTPTLNFLAKFLEYVIQASSDGLTINGKTTSVWPMSPARDAERYRPAVVARKKHLELSARRLNSFIFARHRATERETGT